jgi:hypothetical protein
VGSPGQEALRSNQGTVAAETVMLMRSDNPTTRRSRIVKSIDVEGLPEPVAKAIELVVRTFQAQLV